jgi:hypothetical protein
VIARFRRWRARRRYREHCEVCGRALKPREVVEVTDATFGMTEYGPGGFAITAFYCRTHAPDGVS